MRDRKESDLRSRVLGTRDPTAGACFLLPPRGKGVEGLWRRHVYQGKWHRCQSIHRMMIDNVFWCHVVPKFGRNRAVSRLVSGFGKNFRDGRIGSFAYGEAGFLGDSRGAPGGTRTPNRWIRNPWLYPIELRAPVVGARGFEPPTLCSQSRCATRLRHAPTPRQPTRLFPSKGRVARL